MKKKTGGLSILGIFLEINFEINLKETIEGDIIIQIQYSETCMKKILYNIYIIILCLGCIYNLSACDIGSVNEDASDIVKITMPNDEEKYIGSEWTIDTLREHFNELGFTNISEIPWDTNNGNYRTNILGLTIQDGWFVNNDPWKAGDEFSSDAQITIYYNKYTLLTADNCSDLSNILTSREMDYMLFATKYDGYYVEFDAHVIRHLTDGFDTRHIIDIVGGDYDGVSKLGSYNEEDYKSIIIRAGNYTSSVVYDEDVVEGDNVFVSGRIDASWSEFYNQLYIECVYFEKK